MKARLCATWLPSFNVFQSPEVNFILILISKNRRATTMRATRRLPKSVEKKYSLSWDSAIRHFSPLKWVVSRVLTCATLVAAEIVAARDVNDSTHQTNFWLYKPVNWFINHIRIGFHCLRRYERKFSLTNKEAKINAINNRWASPLRSSINKHKARTLKTFRFLVSYESRVEFLLRTNASFSSHFTHPTHPVPSEILSAKHESLSQFSSSSEQHRQHQAARCRKWDTTAREHSKVRASARWKSYSITA